MSLDWADGSEDSRGPVLPLGPEELHDALRRSEERLRLLIDGALDYGIFMLDPDGVISTWNTGAERIKGYAGHEVIGRHFSMFYTSEARAIRHPEHELEIAAASGRYEEEAWRVRKDGSLFWANVVITALRGDDGMLRGFSKVTRDLTERRRNDEAFRQSEERFRQAFQDAPTPILLFDDGGRIVQANAAVCLLLGYHEAALLSLDLAGLIHPEDLQGTRHALGLLTQAARKSYVAELRLLHAEGGSVWVAFHCVGLVNSGGGNARLLAHAADVGQRRKYEEELIALASRDALTGLDNRVSFYAKLDDHLLRVRRYGPTGAVLMLDLDHFKRVNDTLGHNAGDQLIISTAQMLRRRLRSGDVVARLGGDEFAIVLPEADGSQAQQVASDLLAGARSEIIPFGGNASRPVTTSIGIVMVDSGLLTASELLANADLAMYDSKEAGRDRYSLFSDGEHKVPLTKARLSWVSRIETALDEGGFELRLQPIKDLRRGRVTSHEVLLRMRGNQDDIVDPGRFLYIAERMGLIGQIDRWVTTQSVQLLRDIQRHHPDHTLEVNISGLSVGDEMLREHIAQEITRSGVDPSGLIFEITETAAVQRVQDACRFAESLREIGCKFALDDFGAGFGSFYYLKHLPFDFVKIDGEFISTCTTNVTDQLVIESVVNIARGLGKTTIAEFVTDRVTLDFVRELGVDYAQGYYIGRPVTVTDAIETLMDHL